MFAFARKGVRSQHMFSKHILDSAISSHWIEISSLKLDWINPGIFLIPIPYAYTMIRLIDGIASITKSILSTWRC